MNKSSREYLRGMVTNLSLGKSYRYSISGMTGIYVIHKMGDILPETFITHKEFNQHFMDIKDYREQRLGKLLDK